MGDAFINSASASFHRSIRSVTPRAPVVSALKRFRLWLSGLMRVTKPVPLKFSETEVEKQVNRVVSVLCPPVGSPVQNFHGFRESICESGLGLFTRMAVFDNGGKSQWVDRVISGKGVLWLDGNIFHESPALLEILGHCEDCRIVFVHPVNGQSVADHVRAMKAEALAKAWPGYRATQK